MRSPLQIFRAGPEDVPTYDNTVMNGVPVTDPVNVGWSSVDRPGTVAVPIGPWASGLYFAKLTDENGRIGFAPFVVRPAAARCVSGRRDHSRRTPGRPTTSATRTATAGATRGTRRARRAPSGSGRAFLRRGVPPQYRKYDLGFLRWLAQRGKQPDYLSETDLEILHR